MQMHNYALDREREGGRAITSGRSWGAEPSKPSHTLRPHAVGRSLAGTLSEPSDEAFLWAEKGAGAGEGEGATLTMMTALPADDSAARTAMISRPVSARQTQHDSALRTSTFAILLYYNVPILTGSIRVHEGYSVIPWILYADIPDCIVRFVYACVYVTAIWYTFEKIFHTSLHINVMYVPWCIRMSSKFPFVGLTRQYGMMNYVDWKRSLVLTAL